MSTIKTKITQKIDDHTVTTKTYDSVTRIVNIYDYEKEIFLLNLYDNKNNLLASYHIADVENIETSLIGAII